MHAGKSQTIKSTNLYIWDHTSISGIENIKTLNQGEGAAPSPGPHKERDTQHSMVTAPLTWHLSTQGENQRSNSQTTPKCLRGPSVVELPLLMQLTLTTISLPTCHSSIRTWCCASPPWSSLSCISLGSSALKILLVWFCGLTLQCIANPSPTRFVIWSDLTHSPSLQRFLLHPFQLLASSFQLGLLELCYSLFNPFIAVL